MKRLLLFVILLSFVSCIRPSEERAERDLDIGKASAGGVSFEVAGGLAAVRSAKAGEIVLWNSAPALRLVATVKTGGSWVLRVQIALPDLELSATANGAALDATVLDSPLVTRKAWRIELPASSTVIIDLAPPDAKDLSPWRFAVMSDVQEAIDRVGDIYAKVNEQKDVRYLVGAGDLTQQGGDDELERFQNELRALRVPYYTTLGNHELGHSPTPYQDWFGRASFSYVYRGVRFSMIDSASATIDPMVYDWLDGWLAAAKGGVHVVAMHVPPVDPIGVRNGSFASRNEAAKLLTRLAEGKVDLTLYGHIHSYYDFDNAGIPAYISGGGGAIPERFDKIGRHFLVVDVDPEQGIQDVSVVRVD